MRTRVGRCLRVLAAETRFLEYLTWLWCTSGGRVMLMESRSRTRDRERLSMYPVTARSPRRASAGVGRETGPAAVHAFLTERVGGLPCHASRPAQGDVALGGDASLGGDCAVGDPTLRSPE